MPEDTSFKFDVFISYSHKDKAWVKDTLLPRLEKGGLKVCIDYRDFKPGRSSLLNMQDGARHSRWLLPVLTENWFASEWSFFEALIAAQKAPAGLKERIVPALLRACAFPDDADFIKALTYVDFTGDVEADISWRSLLTAFGKGPELDSPGQPERPGWFLAHPYAMPPNFTGRVDERCVLSGWLHGGAQNAAISDWLNGDPAHPMLVLRALGGFGKSALAWQWLNHDVDPQLWPRAVWWSFYEGDASFEAFVGETLHYLSGGKIQPPAQLSKMDVLALLHALTQPGTLLVLDGIERLLRAFGGIGAAYQGDEVPHDEPSERESIPPLADFFLKAIVTRPDIRSKVLLTTRLRPHAVETREGQLLAGCLEEVLDQMKPADAVEFFRAQGIRGLRAEIEEACAAYGYHPLSLRLLAGVIARDFQQPGDIAVARRISIADRQIQQQHHVLEVAYDSLTPARQQLLGRIACFRSPVKYEALKALAETTAATQRVPTGALDADLHDLIARGLLQHDTKESRFDLHPIVRRYAYHRLTAADKTAAHLRLRDYFAAVPGPDKVTRLEDLAPVIELYHHHVCAGQLDEARELCRDRLKDPLYYQLGAYALIIDLLRPLFPEGEDHPPRLNSEIAQAWTFNELGNACGLSGQPRRAVPLFVQANAIVEKQGNKRNLAIGLGNVAYMAQLPIGELRAAEANLHRSIALSQEIKEEFDETSGHVELGHLLACLGAGAEADKELTSALAMTEKQGNVQGRGLVWAYRAQLALLRVRLAALGPLSLDPALEGKAALAPARRALELADEDARTVSPVERDYVRAHWLLGAAHRVAGERDPAERHLLEALERCRRINNVELEADILIDLARLRAASAEAAEAKTLAAEALVIADRCGFILQVADAHLELARLALTAADPKTAKHHATEARRLATCDGPPDYTYKAAYEEAGALLEQLN
jgi:tetratricopeptide (TPR) repeat protein